MPIFPINQHFKKITNIVFSISPKISTFKEEDFQKYPHSKNRTFKNINIQGTGLSKISTFQRIIILRSFLKSFLTLFPKILVFRVKGLFLDSFKKSFHAHISENINISRKISFLYREKGCFTDRGKGHFFRSKKMTFFYENYVFLDRGKGRFFRLFWKQHFCSYLSKYYHCEKKESLCKSLFGPNLIGKFCWVSFFKPHYCLFLS